MYVFGLKRRRKAPAPPEKVGVFVGSVYGRLLGHDDSHDPYGVRELTPRRPMLPPRRQTVFGQPPNPDSYPQPRR
jgi:hypothetical protein